MGSRRSHGHPWGFPQETTEHIGSCIKLPWAPMGSCRFYEHPWGFPIETVGQFLRRLFFALPIVEQPLEGAA